jgi:tripartite-type tricarboxylate transporter receptor subunit TctC
MARTNLSRRRMAISLFAAATLTTGFSATAQSNDWPSKPVTVISPYNPGGTNDVPIRIFAEHFQRIFGQPFIVKNVPGAAAILGSVEAMKAPADGYTLLATNNGGMIVQSVVKQPAPYHPLRSFTPIVKFVDAVAFIGVSGDLPVNSVGELITLAKREPGKLNYSSAGSGSMGNFLGEYFKLLAGTEIVHIPGKGSAAAILETKAGRIQVMFDPLVLPQSSDGRIKTLAVVAGKRLESQPQVPTVKEAGGPEMDVKGWFGLMGPANLPREIVAKIEAATRKVAEDPEIRKKLLTAGLLLDLEDSTAFRERIERDVQLFTRIKNEAKLVVE